MRITDASAQAQSLQPSRVFWSVDNWDVQAKPFSQISFGQLSFRANNELQNSTLRLSSEIEDVLQIIDDSPANITANQEYFPQIIFYMPPGTSSGWQNGTLGVEVAGTILQETLPINVLVPPVDSESQPNGNGTITYMITPSYSPYFSSVVDIATWFTFSNGTSVPLGVQYDVLDNFSDSELGPAITIATDKQSYGPKDTSIFITGSIRHDTIIADESSAYLSVFSDLAIPHEYHDDLPINPDGAFSYSLPLRGSLSSDGQHTISVLYRGQKVETTVSVLDGTIGDYRTISQGLPTLKGGGELVIANSETLAKVGVNYTLSFLLRSSNNEPVTSYWPIVEIRNSAGITESIFVKPGFRNESFDRWYVQAYWRPLVADTYSINTFVITDLDNPVLRTALKTTYFVVT